MRTSKSVHWLVDGRPACGNRRAAEMSEDLEQVTCMTCLSTKAAREVSGLSDLDTRSVAFILLCRKRVMIRRRWTAFGDEYRVYAYHRVLCSGTLDAVEKWVERHGLQAQLDRTPI